MKIEVHHATGCLASYRSDVVPRVGDTISFIGERHDCREVTRVDWEVYAASERPETKPTGAAAQVNAEVNLVRVFVR